MSKTVLELIRELTFMDLNAEIIVTSEATGDMEIAGIRQVMMEPEDQGEYDEQEDDEEVAPLAPVHQVQIEV